MAQQITEQIDNKYFLQLIKGLEYDELKDLYSFNGKLYRLRGVGVLSEQRKKNAYYFVNVNDLLDVVMVTASSFIPIYDGFNDVKIDFVTRDRIYNKIYYQNRKDENRAALLAAKEKREKEKAKKRAKIEAQRKKEKEKAQAKKLASVKPIKCAFCGKEFLPTQKTQRFCCTACRQKFFSHEQGVKVTLANKSTKHCALCGKEFVGTPRQKYCSRECQVKLSSAVQYAKSKLKRKNSK